MEERSPTKGLIPAASLPTSSDDWRGRLVLERRKEVTFLSWYAPFR